MFSRFWGGGGGGGGRGGLILILLTALISLSEMTALHSYLSLKGHLTSASLLCITDCLMHSLEDIQNVQYTMKYHGMKS